MLQVTVSTLFLALAAAQEQPRVLNPYEFARSAISALSYAESAREVLAEVDGSQSDFVNSSLTSMVALRKAISRLQSGADELKPFVDSSDTSISELARAWTSVFEILQSSFREHLALQEELLKARTLDQLTALTPKASEVAARTDEAWRFFPKIVILLSYVLIDFQRDVNGATPYLRITTAQRQALVKELGGLSPDGKKRVEVTRSRCQPVCCYVGSKATTCLRMKKRRNDSD